jgi:hypothetical protein
MILVGLLLGCSGCVEMAGTFAGNILADQAVKQYDKYEKDSVDYRNLKRNWES